MELLAAGATILILDYSSKRLVEQHLSERGVAWGRVLTLRHISSRRRRYERSGVRALLAGIWLIALGSALILHVSGEQFLTRLSLVGIGAAVGGAAGNLVDIFRKNGVTDFIDLGWWPAFNVADAAIVIGLVAAFWPTA